MNSDEFLVVPKAPLDFELPGSSSSVEVRIIDTGTLLLIDPKLFLHPPLPGLSEIHAPIYCFLITHPRLNKQVLFDLGVRADWRTYAPKIVKLIAATTTVTQGPDIATFLDSDDSGLGIRSTDIDSIIWSHNHFDHTGDPSTFPGTTELVVGPGVKTLSWPGYPTVQGGAVLDSDATGRIVREISFEGEGALKIGRFDAFDFFGDGSFYLLDAPGHAIGHMCGLARTTHDPASFVFMGADACHHVGILRPTDYQPLPREIAMPDLAEQGSFLGANGVPMCPGEILQQLTIDKQPTSPFLQVPHSIVFPDRESAMETVSKIHELDARDDVFTIIAHDVSLRDRMAFFPDTVNSWKALDLSNSTRWLFCRDFKGSLPN